MAWPKNRIIVIAVGAAAVVALIALAIVSIVRSFNQSPAPISVHSIATVAPATEPTTAPANQISPQELQAQRKAALKRVKDYARRNPTEFPNYVTSLAHGLDGSIWVGAQDGLWRYQSDGQRIRYHVADGLGDECIYAVAVDKLGRVWVGHLNHGVSVFNGEKWQNYEVVGGLSRPDTLSGPLGERIFHITVNPKDGDVWMATSAGLSRYGQSKNTWTYYTRAEGLPSDQANSIAFDADGNIYVATQCDGIAMANFVDDYKTWRTITGPDETPTQSHGDGIPTNLMNDILVSHDNVVYAATTTGLARSYDRGQTWHYIRGADWLDKAKGRIGGPPADLSDDKEGILAEDYITSIAEEPNGRLDLGHWRQGYEVLDPNRGEIISRFEGDGYVKALLPIEGEKEPVRGRNGETPVLPPESQLVSAFAESNQNSSTVIAFPSPAALPSVDQLQAATQHFRSLSKPNGDAEYLGQDWSTEGDWVGRYGRQLSILCGADAPMDRVWGSMSDGYEFDAKIGPNANVGDGLRRWLTGIKSESHQSLYDPYVGCRRSASIDDHGEEYPMTHEGPDIWIKVAVPAGTYRVSLYFEAVGKTRDYEVDLLPWRDDIGASAGDPILARFRTIPSLGSVYHQFVINGPSQHWVHIKRDGSLNAECAGVFINKLIGKQTAQDRMGTPMLGNLTYKAPNAGVVDSLAAQVRAPVELWTSVAMATANIDSISQQNKYNLLAYRAALASNAPKDLLSNRRWAMPIWNADDRAGFYSMMAAGWMANAKLNPAAAKEADRELDEIGEKR